MTKTEKEVHEAVSFELDAALFELSHAIAVLNSALEGKYVETETSDPGKNNTH